MEDSKQTDTEDNVPSVIDRYFTRWYRAGKYKLGVYFYITVCERRVSR